MREKIAIALFVAVVLLAGLAWWLAAPKGELRLALDPSIQGDAAKTAIAAQLFQLADSQVDDAQTHHERLSLADPDNPAPLVSLPPTQSPGGHTLQNLITGFVIETTVDQGTGRIALSIDGVALLESLYSAVGWHDYFLAIDSIETIDCGGQEGSTCYKVGAKFSPSQLRPEILEGTVEDIARDIAVLVLWGVVLDREIAWADANKGTSVPEPYLFAPSIPRRMAALKAAADGIDILLKGKGHPDCVTLSPQDCRQRAKEEFEVAVAAGPHGSSGNPMAALGLSLIAVEEGLSSAQILRDGSLIESKFGEAERWMKQAQQSTFIRQKLSDSKFLSQFQALRLEGGVLDEDFFKNVTNFVCTLDAYRRGDWESCLNNVGDLNAYPKALKPYVAAVKYYAELRDAEGDAAREATKSEIRQQLTAIADDPELTHYQRRLRSWSLRRVLALDACIHPESMSEEDFTALARSFVSDAPDSEAWQIAKIEVAGCQVGPAVVPAAEVDTLNDLPETVDSDESRHRLELALAKYYVRVGDLDIALELLKRALALSYVGPYVRATPEFAPFRESQPHMEAFLVVFYSSEEFAELACQQGFF